MARRLIAALFAAVLLVAGCAEAAPPTLAAGSVEAALPTSIWPDDPALATAIDCPDLDETLVAQSTVCTAVLDADPITVDVVVDDAGTTTAAVREPLFVVAEAAASLVERLRADLGIEAIDASCTRVVVIAAIDRVLACDATDGSRVIAFELVLGVSSGSGSWTLRVVD